MGLLPCRRRLLLVVIVVVASSTTLQLLGDWMNKKKRMISLFSGGIVAVDRGLGGSGSVSGTDNSVMLHTNARDHNIITIGHCVFCLSSLNVKEDKYVLSLSHFAHKSLDVIIIYFFAFLFKTFK